MNDTPLNPDACKAADEAMELRMKEFFAGLMTNGEMVDVIVSAYLAVAQPEVNSVEELDALPVESVAMDKHGYVYLLVDEDDEFKWSRNGLDAKFPSWGIVLPARVLYRPVVKP